MTNEPHYVLVEDGHLHHYPAFEECNVDDARVVRRNLTQFDVDALEVKDGPVERCARCFPTWTDAGGKEFDVLRDDPNEDVTVTDAG